MKKIVSTALTAALVLSLSTSIFALPGAGPVPGPGPAPLPGPAPVPGIVNMTLGQIIRPNYLQSLAEKQAEEKVKAACEADIAKLEESLKALRDEMKAIRDVKPVDETAISALKEKEKALNDEVKALRDSMHKQIERAKLVVKFGEDAVVKIEALQAAFATEESTVKASKDEIKAQIDELSAAEIVDEDKIAELEAAEKALEDGLRAKRDAMNKEIEGIKLVAEYGEAIATQIQTLKAAFATEESTVKASKDEIKAQIDELLAAETVDTAKVDELKAAEKALEDGLRAKRDAMNKEIEGIKLVAKYGKDAADQILAIKAEFEAEESTVRASKEAIKAQIDELLAAETVDTAKVEELRASERALEEGLRVKRDASNEKIERIKLVAQYGEDVIAQIEKVQASFEEKVSAFNTSKVELQEKLKALREVKPVDKTAEEALMAEEKALNDNIKAEKEAFDKAVELILATVTAPATAE